VGDGQYVITVSGGFRFTDVAIVTPAEGLPTMVASWIDSPPTRGDLDVYIYDVDGDPINTRHFTFVVFRP
jgi:hypothetical protein